MSAFGHRTKFRTRTKWEFDGWNPDVFRTRRRLRDSFARIGLTKTLGASLGRLEPGYVEISLSPDPTVSQQHGYVHAGAVTTIADTAAGYAAMSLLLDGREILTVEFKVNFLEPTKGDSLVARGSVVSSIGPLTFTRADVYGITAGEETMIGATTATMMSVGQRKG